MRNIKLCESRNLSNLFSDLSLLKIYQKHPNFEFCAYYKLALASKIEFANKSMQKYAKMMLEIEKNFLLNMYQIFVFAGFVTERTEQTQLIPTQRSQDLPSYLGGISSPSHQYAPPLCPYFKDFCDDSWQFHHALATTKTREKMAFEKLRN